MIRKKLLFLLFLCLYLQAPPCTSQVQPRIVNGSTTNIQSVPYQASIQDSQGHFCGGTIIDSTWVITAAHCVEQINKSTTRIVAGTSNINNKQNGQIREIDEVIIHAGYDPLSLDRDIALLRLTLPLTSSDSIQSINYITFEEALKGAVSKGTLATVSGWGKTEQGISTSEYISKAVIPIADHTLANSPAYYNGQLTDNMLAAGYENEGPDACQGDSGGPLVIENENKEIKLAGIVSWGYKCGEMFGVYTNVSIFSNWISNVMSNKPIPSVTDIDDFIFLNDSITIQNTSYGENNTYTWKITGPEALYSEKHDLTFNPKQLGEYHIKLIAENQNGIDSLSFIINSIEPQSNCNTQYEGLLTNFITAKNSADEIITSSNHHDEFYQKFTLNTNSIHQINGVSFRFAQTDYMVSNDSWVYITLLNKDGQELLHQGYSPEKINLKKDKDVYFEFPTAVITSDSVITVRIDLWEFAYVGETIVLYSYEVGNSNAGVYDYFGESYTSMNTLGANVNLACSLSICKDDIPLANKNSQPIISNQLYPNPAKEFFILFVKEKGSLYLYDDMGNLISEQLLLPGKNNINISNFTEGIYSGIFFGASQTHKYHFLKN